MQGELITDYIAYGAAQPADPPSLGAAGQWAIRQDTRTGQYWYYDLHLAAWRPLHAGPADPWTPHSASAWYASDGATPVAWTLDAGLAVSYAAAEGYAKLTWPLDTTVRKAVAALTGAAPFHLVARVRPFNGQNQFYTYLGFSAAGDVTDLDGLLLSPNGGIQQVESGTPASSNIDNNWGYVGTPWMYVWMSLIAGTLAGYVSVDGVAYDQAFAVASALTPTKMVLAVQAGAAAAGPASALWLDYIALGNTAPAGQ
jgi:hypothetical protein